MKLKIGDTAEVIEVTDSSYPVLYENGAWGTIADEFPYGVSAHIGNTLDTDSTWSVPNGTYRKVGRLTIKALKHG